MWFRLVLLPALLWCAPTIAIAQDDLEKEFRSAQRAIQTQMKSKNREQRLAAVRKIEAYPVVDAAKLLLLTGLASGDGDVRKASYEALLKFKEEKPIGLFLAISVEKDLKRDAVDEGTCGAMCTLLASSNQDLEHKADDLLKMAAGTANTSGLLLLVSVADELGAEGTENGLKGLRRLLNLPCFTQDFAFRRAVTQALTQIRKPEGVEVLLDILPSARGEVRSDILRYLTTISAEQIGPHPDEWSAWWKANKAAFRFPEREKVKLPGVAARMQPGVAANMRLNAAAKELAPAAGGSYYGLPLAERIVFVMDTSTSMRGARIEAAKRELIRAIAQLPDESHFGVLVFNTRTSVWQEQLVPATSENKELACQYVALQELGPNTASYDALEAALAFDAEAIYFLTDGAPFGGKVTRPDAIVTLITRLNRLRRITINSIGIGVGREGNAFDVFLRSISASNYGEYVRVDE